ncbi:hypothetical protein [Paracoccus marinaquae]|uniref:Uncharacterized protein n=1 Tax=Paracoccus marinaquae TaxID=2841926 RepID=A0ABS6ANT9_9RHOB|nr:hypothetical protein [Paracoccus marinaquae]MBU3032263.1 hypothetical protein [Paracoccus marinaquae]
MPDDALTEAKATGTPTGGQGTDARGTDNPLTGRVDYYFWVPTSDGMKARHQTPAKVRDFHLEVWDQLFGPKVRQTSYVRHGGYDALVPKLTPPGKELPERIAYSLPKYVIDKVGIIPRIKPARIVRDGEDYDAPETFSAQSGLLETLEAGPADTQTILYRNIGFYLEDATFWKSLPLDQQGAALAEVTRAVALLGDLDDAAHVELLETLPPVYQARRGQIAKLDFARIRRFNAQLEKLKAATESRARKSQLIGYDAALETASLVGCHELYFLRKDYHDAPYEGGGEMVIISGTGRAVAPKPSAQRLRLEAAYHRMLAEKGFNHATLGKLISRFVDGFEKRTADFARKLLTNYLRIFEYHVAKTNVGRLVAEIRKHHGTLLREIFNEASLNSFESIQEALKRSGTRLKHMSREFPILKYANFWTIYAKSHEYLDGKFSIAHFRLMVSRTRKAIRRMLKELRDDSGYVWKGEKIVSQALAQFGIYADPKGPRTHNAMLTEIVQARLARERKKGVLKGLLLAIVALALSLSGVGALVVIGAAIGLADVYMMIGDQVEIQSRKLAGFSDQDPPSDFWILLAVAGAGADVAGLAKLLSAGKSAALARSAGDLRDLLVKAEVASDKVLEAAEAARVVRIEIDDAVAAAKKTSNALADAAGARHLSDIAYGLARLRLSEFDHFLLELAHRKVLSAIPDSTDLNVILRALDSATEARLRRLWQAGVTRARDRLANLDELIEAAEEVGKQKNKATQAATDFYEKFRKHAKNRKDPKGPYLARREEHYALKRVAERLELKEKALKAQIRKLKPRSGQTSSAWGYDAEDAIKVIDDWPDLGSNIKAVDSIRVPRDNGGIIDVMQSKAVVDPLESELVTKVSAKMREALGKMKSDKWARLRRGIEEGTTPLPSELENLKLPANWQSETIRFRLEIPIVTDAAMDLVTLRKEVLPLFKDLFPPNAVLKLRTISEDEIVNALKRGAEALE